MGKTGKLLLNVLILLVIAGFVWYVVRSVNKEETTYTDAQPEQPFSTPYRQVASFEVPEEISRFALHNGQLLIATGQTVYLYDKEGTRQGSFAVKPGVRDIAAGGDSIYVLYPASIEVYTAGGELLHQWEACSELSDYCSLALAGGFVFVTDAENKNICQYTREGNFVKFVSSPQGFIVPSYSFDIDSWNDTIYCGNSGRHLIETYALNGDFLAAFGGAGSEAGSFAGCCNPAYISFAPDGTLITSEKGNPRISTFERNGTFQATILNSKLLGGGNKAYEVKADDDLLFVAGRKTVSVFRLKDK